jgi:hypothetical protein
MREEDTYMVELQWEYCTLSLMELKFKKNLIYCDLSVSYLGVSNEFHFLLSVMNIKIESLKPKGWSYNPWNRAISLLGVGGWELVNIQHGSAPSVINMSNAVAYFKRPIQPGRRVDEPKIELP